MSVSSLLCEISWYMGPCFHKTQLYIFLVTIILKFIGFNASEFRQPENTFVLTKALWHHKHLSANLIAVRDIMIWKSLAKPVMTGHAKVSTTKRWCDRPQTQQYVGSGTGYFGRRTLTIPLMLNQQSAIPLPVTLLSSHQIDITLIIMALRATSNCSFIACTCRPT